MLKLENGFFSGYASIFGEVDQGGDIVMPGAFSNSLAKKSLNGIRLLFQHDVKEPIGRVLQLFEDQNGLKVEGQLTKGVPRAQALGALIENGALDGLSIGFRTIRSTKDKISGHRRLLQIDLWEVSIVTFPMMERARITLPTKPPEQFPRPIRSQKQTIAAAISLLSNS
ncbi:MAG: HK97 family phage prohead protease [Devosiaceae bacterium]|nr:HK97 family phage prohead protease [Devosiaceae bacterium]